MEDRGDSTCPLGDRWRCASRGPGGGLPRVHRRLLQPLNLAYSLGLKNVSIIDILVIALGFLLRIEGGAVLIGVQVSTWILICAGLLALFIAIAKRRDDLVRILDQTHRHSLKGYNLQFLDVALVVVLSALLISYLIYTTDRLVMVRFGTERLYLTVPFVVAGVLTKVPADNIRRAPERNSNVTGAD